MKLPRKLPLHQFQLLFLFLCPMVVFAEDAKAPAPAPQAAASPAAPASTAVTYELRDLRPAGFTQYQGAGDALRLYFDFQNDQGTHHVIYEEVGSAAPARSVQELREAAVAYDSQCSMDIECSSKAFCTGDCRHMYYETANAPGDTLAPDRNKCHVTYFTCEKAGASRIAAPAAVTPTAAAPAAQGI